MRKTPFVYWAQDEERVELRVDIQHAEEVGVSFSDDGKLLHFTATSTRSGDMEMDNGRLEYSFQLPLFQPVQGQPKVKAHEGRVEIELRKRKKAFWKSGLLSAEAQKPAWLKFDFEKWRDDPDEQILEDAGDSIDALGRKNPYLERMLREMEQEGKLSLMSDEEFAKRMSLIYGTYMLVYNLGMFLVHFGLLSLLLFRFFSTPRAEFLAAFWPANFQTLMALTCLQYLDCLHSLAGLTKSSYKTSLLQVTGRVAMLLIVNGCPPCTTWPPASSLVFVYLLSEQFRYPYYALSSIGLSVPLISWLRYNAWLLLYPIGLCLEGLILVRSIPDYLHSGVYSLQMPNRLNMSFNFGLFLAVFTATCFPYIAFTLLKHMKRQRSAKMAGKGAKKTA